MKLTERAWAVRAACRGMTPKLFFPVEGENAQEVRHREAKAKKICDGCPVRGPCLDAGMARDDYGIWGGTTSQDRDVMRGKNPRRNRK